ncbi:MAG: alpha-L-rhamnosidase [bacterium]|nr:alpha-L-rhamnosidase [bacterium]
MREETASMKLTVENSQPDPRVRRLVMPKRIVWQSGVPDAERLLDPNGAMCVMKHKGTEPSVLLDFGRELHGGVRVTNGRSPGHKPIRVRIRFGESASEAMGEPNNDHAIHNHVCDIPWYGYEEIGNTGFRFVRIDLLEPNTELHVEAVRAVFIYRDLDYAGTFSCNDDRLNQIWQTGAYTVHLCMQDMLWDGIKRDRLVWIGDMHPETMVINTVFGDQSIVPESLDYVKGKTPLPGWMNGISSYSLWWILIQHCWYLHHGNKEYLAEQREYLNGLLKRLQGEIAENGSEALTGHRFLDWPSSGDQQAIHAGLHALMYMAFRAGAELCHVLDDAAMHQGCLDAMAKLRHYAPPPTTSKQASALLAIAGLAEAGETNHSILAVEPLHGLSTFYGYYVLQARAMAGDYQGCLDAIRGYWGAMIDLGATTFWEDFHLSWTTNAAGIEDLVPEGKDDIHGDFGDYCYKGLRHSLCHGWAAGPTAWLTQHVLGIRSLEPGCARIAVEPHLGDLEWAEGTFPTPRGLVTVRHERQADGSLKSTVDVPDGVEVA